MEKKVYQQPVVTVTPLKVDSLMLMNSPHNIYSDQPEYAKRRGGGTEDDDDGDLITW
ncbi:MAG: hypothetical protein IJV06_00885 [Bacteroidaceae bacterium]|nr:hypothetical protein [Bacteroidaceae bacterium]